MSKQPFLPLFFGDFLASTAEWTGEERSLYLTLLGHQWSLGSLPVEPDKVRRIVQWDRKLFASCWPTVSEKFAEQDGRLINARLEQHREKSNDLAEKNRASGRKGAAVRWGANGERYSRANGEGMAGAIAAPSKRHRNANGVTHSNPSHPILKNPPTPRKRGGRAPDTTTIPDDFALDEALTRYATDHLPNVDASELFEKFREQAAAKGWRNADWRRAFQTYVRNCAPNSGHWAAGQYPTSGTAIQWQ